MALRLAPGEVLELRRIRRRAAPLRYLGMAAALALLALAIIGILQGAQ